MEFEVSSFSLARTPEEECDETVMKQLMKQKEIVTRFTRAGRLKVSAKSVTHLLRKRDVFTTQVERMILLQS